RVTAARLDVRGGAVEGNGRIDVAGLARLVGPLHRYIIAAALGAFPDAGATSRDKERQARTQDRRQLHCIPRYAPRSRGDACQQHNKALGLIATKVPRPGEKSLK